MVSSITECLQLVNDCYKEIVIMKLIVRYIKYAYEGFTNYILQHLHNISFMANVITRTHPATMPISLIFT